METQLEREIQHVENLIRRRKILAQHVTDDVLEAMVDMFDLKDRIFMFSAKPDGQYDPLQAMRYDTLRGCIEALKFEREHVGAAEAILDNLKQRKNQLDV